MNLELFMDHVHDICWVCVEVGPNDHWNYVQLGIVTLFYVQSQTLPHQLPFQQDYMLAIIDVNKDVSPCPRFV